MLDFNTSISGLGESLAGDAWARLGAKHHFESLYPANIKIRIGLLFLFSKIIIEHNSVVTYRTMES